MRAVEVDYAAESAAARRCFVLRLPEQTWSRNEARK
jgi:hypothetical protein